MSTFSDEFGDEARARAYYARRRRRYDQRAARRAKRHVNTLCVECDRAGLHKSSCSQFVSVGDMHRVAHGPSWSQATRSKFRPPEVPA